MQNLVCCAFYVTLACLVGSAGDWLRLICRIIIGPVHGLFCMSLNPEDNRQRGESLVQDYLVNSQTTALTLYNQRCGVVSGGTAGLSSTLGSKLHTATPGNGTHAAAVFARSALPRSALTHVLSLLHACSDARQILFA